MRWVHLALALCATGAAPPDWQLVRDGEVKVYARARAGERVKELRAVMEMDATPLEIRAVLTDPGYAARTPYVAESRVVDHPAPGVWIKYTRLSFPIVEDRDYFIRLTREADLNADGSGVYHTAWKACGLDRPIRKGVVRLTDVQGFWDVRPADKPGYSVVTYYLLSDAGGLVPAWVINLGNRRVMPDILAALYQEVLHRRQAAAR